MQLILIWGKCGGAIAKRRTAWKVEFSNSNMGSMLLNSRREHLPIVTILRIKPRNKLSPK